MRHRPECGEIHPLPKRDDAWKNPRVPILRVATDDEKRSRDALTFPEWGSRLTLDQYRVREERLRAQRWARERMTTFVWADGDSILASCEAFRMDSVLRGAAGVLRGNTHGIASVFTEVTRRGAGHATRMMRALVRTLPERDAQAQASILFSDVGPALYERAGYRAQPCDDWIRAAAKTAFEVDAWFRDTDLERAASLLPIPGDPFGVVISAGQLDWHLERERVYAEALRLPRPRFCGAQVGRATGIWTARYVGNELLLLVLTGTEPERASLVRAAQRVAFDAGLARVRGWLSPNEQPPAGTDRLARADSLPMLCPLTAGLDASMWRFIPRALWE